MKTIVHINQHVIKRNSKTGERKPVITVKTYKSNQYGHSVEGDGKWKIVYEPDKPLGCGATVWLVTEDDVKVIKKKG